MLTLDLLPDLIESQTKTPVYTTGERVFLIAAGLLYLSYCESCFLYTYYMLNGTKTILKT